MVNQSDSIDFAGRACRVVSNAARKKRGCPKRPSGAQVRRISWETEGLGRSALGILASSDPESTGHPFSFSRIVALPAAPRDAGWSAFEPSGHRFA